MKQTHFIAVNTNIIWGEDAMRVLVRHLGRGARIVFNNHMNIASVKYRLARLRRRGGFEGMSLAEVHDIASRHGLEIEKSCAMGFCRRADGS
jgi:hypothetical protein